MVDHVRRERIDRIERLGLGAERLCANAHIKGEPADVVELMHEKDNRDFVGLGRPWRVMRLTRWRYAVRA